MVIKKAEGIFWCSKYKKIVDMGDCKWCRECEPWKKDSYAKDYYTVRKIDWEDDC